MMTTTVHSAPRRYAVPRWRLWFGLFGGPATWSVQWVNPVRMLSESKNPGMGVRFVDLSADDRERIVDTIRTIAYVRDNRN